MKQASLFTKLIEDTSTGDADAFEIEDEFDNGRFLGKTFDAIKDELIKIGFEEDSAEEIAEVIEDHIAENKLYEVE